jgi:hypothetical protein
MHKDSVSGYTHTRLSGCLGYAQKVIADNPNAIRIVIIVVAAVVAFAQRTQFVPELNAALLPRRWGASLDDGGRWHWQHKIAQIHRVVAVLWGGLRP